ncbi:MAG: hypothetical protein IJQ82_12825 [Selenomonadaceae bacterium]|nr:hypothetical protein [Selenomonadaceae bacterium]
MPSLIFQRPLTAEEKKFLESKTKPSQEDVQAAQDELFMNILLRLNELESKKEPES